MVIGISSLAHQVKHERGIHNLWVKRVRNFDLMLVWTWNAYRGMLIDTFYFKWPPTKVHKLSRSLVAKQMKSGGPVHAKADPTD